MHYGDLSAAKNSALGGTVLQQASYSGDGPASAAAGRVTEAFENLRRLIEQAHQEIGVLESRIAPVLRPQAPAATGQTAEKQRNDPSQLGAGLEGVNAHLYALIGYVQSLHSRVDL